MNIHTLPYGIRQLKIRLQKYYKLLETASLCSVFCHFGALFIHYYIKIIHYYIKRTLKNKHFLVTLHSKNAYATT